ncbi:TRAP transporter substrate-binding protein [Desulfonatronovibrio hydrogenovorans]|uniref:TRAP transporter substrate-binding protein n=1 Tax=Desulfonatronovibrio hydrogenovorans TaxID=53245 RepID=UPI000491A2DB|nr:TRAP transporter substrate-binding protein [Desulfonatronovibrio hydrogenovorans]
MKSKFTLWIGIAFLAMTPFLWSCASDEAADPHGEPAQVFRLSMATFWPSTAFQVAEMQRLWIDEVARRTEGRVVITLHSGEVLLGAREIYNGVVSGVADIGTTCPSYTPGMFPLTEAFELPGYRNVNAAAASATINEGYKKIRDDLGIDEFEDVKVLFLWATGPGNIMSKAPVRTLEDMAGMEIRAVGGTVPSIESLGATTHAMPMSESYLALDQGLVNGILAPNETLRAFRLSEVISHVTNTPFLYNVAFIKIMNKRTWDSLPADIQAILEEMNDEFAIKYATMMDEFSQDILDQAVEERGIEVINLTDDERQRWLARVEPVVDKWIQRREGQGLPASDVVEIVRELDETYSDYYGN